MSSVEDAISETGFALPRVSPAYPNPFGTISITEYPKGRGLLVQAVYSHPKLSDANIIIQAGPASLWDGGDDNWKKGSLVSIGKRQGWEFTDEGSRYFAYNCGNSHGSSVWCVVSVIKKLSQEDFEAFIADLS